MYIVPGDYGDIFAKMSGSTGRDWNADALADHIRAGPWHLLCPQFQMVVRFVHPDHTWMVQVGRWEGGAEGGGRIVKEWRKLGGEADTSDKSAVHFVS